MGPSPIPPLLNNRIVREESMRRAGAGRACIFWQNDCRRRMRGRQVSKSCHSGVICSLGQWFLVARAEIASPAFLSIGCGTDRFHHSSVRVRLSAGAGEPLPSVKPTASSACRVDWFRRPVIRVCPPQERTGLTIRTLPPFEYRSGGQGLCEHAIADKPIFSSRAGTASPTVPSFGYKKTPA